MRRWLLGSIGLAFATAVTASADDRPTLHEYVPNVAADEGGLLVSSGGRDPEAIVHNGEIILPPEGGELRSDEQAMQARPGDGAQREEPGRRSASFRPDRVTQLHGTVGYYTVFSPTIAPFKRVSAMDRVSLAPDGVPILTISDPHTEREPIEGLSADSDGRDQFWGSVVLDFREGAKVPFPSVSPESRVRTLHAEPPALIHLERDGADNFYAVVASARPPPEVRVIFLSDAPRSYFGTALPEVPVDSLGDRIRPLPASVARDGLTFAAELGLTRRSSFREAVRALVAHFRSFEESEVPPHNSGNIFLDLARGRRGICRHRAYAFVITAQSLGVHARFVQNEAHAWVEVELPEDRGWLRIDLGGAATGLEAVGARDRPVYSPNVTEDLPRPEAYERAYEEARRMSGLRQGSDGQVEGDSGQGGGSQEGGGGGGAQGPGGPTEADGSADPGRRPLRLLLDDRRFEVLRGHELEVTGRAQGPGSDGVPGLRVEVLLRAAHTQAERLLGVTVSREHGHFRGVFGVPHDLAVGDYRLIVHTPGNSEWSSAQAR